MALKLKNENRAISLLVYRDNYGRASARALSRRCSYSTSKLDASYPESIINGRITWLTFK